MTRFNKIVPTCGFAIAVLLVVVTSSFKGATNSRNGQQLFTFMYNPPTTDLDPLYSKASVENEANWTFAPGTNCQTGSIKACTIEATKVDDPNSPTPVLLQTESITAQYVPSVGAAHVVSTIDGSSSAYISNRTN